jgi:hypothetical protein
MKQSKTTKKSSTPKRKRLWRGGPFADEVQGSALPAKPLVSNPRRITYGSGSGFVTRPTKDVHLSW